MPTYEMSMSFLMSLWSRWLIESSATPSLVTAMGTACRRDSRLSIEESQTRMATRRPNVWYRPYDHAEGVDRAVGRTSPGRSTLRIRGGAHDDEARFNVLKVGSPSAVKKRPAERHERNRCIARQNCIRPQHRQCA